MRVRWRRYCHDVRSGTRDRLIQISKCLRHSTALGSPTSAFCVRTYEAHDFETCGSQGRKVNSATEPRADNQRRRLGRVPASHDHPAYSVMVQAVYAPFEMASR